jgi:hypothetical protein
VQVCNLLVLAISAFIIHQLLLRSQLELLAQALDALDQQEGNRTTFFP